MSAQMSDPIAARPRIVPFPPATDDWRKDLLCFDGSMKPRPNTANALLAFTRAPEFRSVLWYDEFRDRIMCSQEPDWGGGGERPWTADDDARSAVWLQHAGMDIKTATAREALAMAARETRRNTLQEHLLGLRWDGVPRVHDWLTVYFGVEDTPLTRAIGRAWLISAMARAFRPGCQADHCLILEGEQGIRKSTALRTLAGKEFYAEHVARNLSDKEAAMLVRGAWIVEFSELEGLRSNRQESVKAFMTRPTDRYVRKYENHAVDVDRSCVFCGTTNRQVYLSDETGGRRYWSVWCEYAHADELGDMRENLLAEALTLYQAHEPWHLTRSMEQQAAREQAQRLETDPWSELIADWIRGRESVSTAEILIQRFGRSETGLTRAEEMRVASCLLQMRWVRYKTNQGKRRYKAPEKVTHKPKPC